MAAFDTKGLVVAARAGSGRAAVDGSALSRAEQAEKTRSQIVDTAQRLFTAHGFEATTLQMIADELDLTKAAVYYHFHTKSEILRASLEPAITTLTALLDDAAAIRSRRQRLEFLATGWVDFLVANRTIAVMGLNDPDTAAKRARSRVRQRNGPRLLKVLYGDAPTPDERAAHALFVNMPETLPELDDLPDDELRDVLLRTALRLLTIR